MKTFLLALLKRTIQFLVNVDWNVLVADVMEMWNDKARTSEEKRLVVFDRLKQYGAVGATWALNIAIEIAYAEVLTRMTEGKK